jgi:sugar phosphate isomerase/epimerase
LNEKHGVKGIYHVHSGIAQHGASVWDILISLRDHDPRYVGINYDVGHATVEGGFGGWIHTLNACGPHTGGVALKDFLWARNAKGEWRPEWCPLGEGMVNFLEFGKRLAASPFAGPVQLHMEYELGGAGHGDRTITWPRDRVAAAMRRDLERARAALRA